MSNAAHTFEFTGKSTTMAVNGKFAHAHQVRCSCCGETASLITKSYDQPRRLLLSKLFQVDALDKKIVRAELACQG